MPSRKKLRATLIQTFGSPLFEGTRSGRGSRSERETVLGGEAPADDRLPVEGDIVGGHYRLVRRLGLGMFGCVYVAERTDVPEHRVALKVVHRAVYGGRDVERELVMLAATTHPHIVQLKDHGMTADYVWLTMPLYEGETLAERLERGPLSLREAYQVFLPIARGVHALHERGLRHQDIKPENIYLAEIGGTTHPVLLDLGVAVEAGSPFVAGTALYCAPEQLVALGGLEGRGELSEKMDTYGLAATLLRAVVGSAHFPGEDATTPFDIATAFEVRETQPLAREVLPQVSGEPRLKLRLALSRWLTRDPDVRPSTGQLAAELDVLLEQEREAAAAIEHEIAQQKSSLRRVRITLVAALLAGAAVLLWGLSHRETLRLARELERARAAGAASFDKLDTCVAAHQLARSEATSCAADRERAHEAHRTTLATLGREHAQATTALDARVARQTRRFHGCLDDKKRALQTWETERESLDRVIGERDKTLVAVRAELGKSRAEREQAETAKSACEGELDAVSTAKKTSDDALASCVLERDAFEKAAARAAVAGAASDRSAPPVESTESPAAVAPTASDHAVRPDDEPSVTALTPSKAQ